MNLVDTHAHLDFADDVEGWIERAKTEGVNKIICVGTSVEASKKYAELAEKYSDAELRVYATVGIHAQDGKDDVKRYGSLYQCINTLKQIALSSKKVVGVGECGYDFYLDNEKRIETVNKDNNFQKELFEVQIGLAAELGLPLLIHCRNAWPETFELLEKYPLSFPRKRESSSGFRIKSGMTGERLHGLFHSWTGDWQTAKKALALGFYISFSGIVTFKNATDIQNVAKNVPLDRMLVETDSPFLSPEPFRGKTNEPKNVKIVGEFIAQLRNFSADKVAKITSENAERLFGFK